MIATFFPASLAGLIVLGVANAHACVMGDGKYDDLAAPGVLAVHAVVRSVDAEIEGKAACLNVTYEVKEVLLGQHAGPLASSTCYPLAEDPDLQRLKRDWLKVSADNPYAFNKGSDVLAVLTKERAPGDFGSQKNPDTYRMATPTCWGPVHMNLASFSEKERLELLQDVRNWKNDTRKTILHK